MSLLIKKIAEILEYFIQNLTIVVYRKTLLFTDKIQRDDISIEIYSTASDVKKYLISFSKFIWWEY